MSDKKFKITVNEDELKALIKYLSDKVANEYGALTLETSQRIHDLMKRLHRDTPEIENDPRPKNADDDPDPIENTSDGSPYKPQATKEGW